MPVLTRPRRREQSVARQVLVLQLFAVLVLVVTALALATYDARADIRAGARDEAVSVAQTVARTPLVHEAIASGDPSALLQPYAEAVRVDTGVDFVVVMDTDRTRWSHPNPDLLGQKFIGNIATALEGTVRLEASPPVPETKIVEASGKSFNTIPPSDFGFFEMINANVQQEPADSYNVELAGQLAAIGIVKGKPFEPDERMRKILTDAAAMGSAISRSLNWRSDDVAGWAYYPGSGWSNMLWEGGAYFETPPPLFEDGMFKPFPPTGARTLDSRTAFYYAYTLDSPGMIMRIPGVGSQYLVGFLDDHGDPFDGAKTYKVTLPKDIPAEAFWSFTLYDNQTRSMLQTPQKYPRAGSQSYPSPAAETAADGATVVYFGPTQPKGVGRGNWIQTDPKKGWFTILRLYSPLPSFFDKTWRPSEVELVK